MQMESAAVAVLQLVREIHNIAVQVEENNTLCVELSLECDLIVPPVEVLQNSPLETRCADALNTTLKLLNKVKKYVEKYGEKTFSRTVKNWMWESRREEIERFKVKLRFCVHALTLTHAVEANVAATAAREAPLITEESNKQLIAEQLRTLRICIARGSVEGSISATRIGFFREDLAETQSAINNLRLPYPVAQSVAYRNEIAELSTLLDGLTAQCTLATLAADIRDLYQQPQEACVLLMATDDNIDVDDGTAISGKKRIMIDDLFVTLTIVDDFSHGRREKTAVSTTEQLAEHQSTNKSESIGRFIKKFLTQPRYISNLADSHLGVLYDDETIYGKKTHIDVSSIFNGELIYTEALLLGKAGIGKTTLCRYLAYEWATNRLWPAFRFVFFIKLQEVAALTQPDPAKAESIPHILWLYILRKLGVSENKCEKIWSDIVSERGDGDLDGGVLFILDGYDEVAESSNTMCETLVKVRELPGGSNIKVIITSRPHIHISRRIDLVLESIGFTRENIYAYIARYYSRIACIPDHDQISAGLCAYLDQHPNIMQMCNVPINLELMCSIWRSEQERFKEGNIVMSDLYETFLSKLMHRYVKRKLDGTSVGKDIASSAHRVTVNRAVMTHPHCVNALYYLEELAFRGFMSGRIIISPTILEALEKKRLNKDVLNFYNEIGLLKAIGNINSPVREQYFIHLSFQEYLAARFIVRHIYCNETSMQYTVEQLTAVNNGPRTCTVTVEQIMANNKYNPRFLLVWMYAAGLLRSYQIVNIEDDSARTDRVHTGFITFFSRLFGKSRDLYGFYEIELLMRCGEEAKWKGSALWTNLLEFVGKWVIGVSDHNLADSIARLFSACPLAITLVTYRPYRGIFNILTNVSCHSGSVERAVMNLIHYVCKLSGNLLESTLLNALPNTQKRLLEILKISSFAPTALPRFQRICRQLILGDDINVKLTALDACESMRIRTRSLYGETVLVLNNFLFRACLDKNDISQELWKYSGKCEFLGACWEDISSVVNYFCPKNKCWIASRSFCGLRKGSADATGFVSTHFCLWALLTLPSDADIRPNLLNIFRYQCERLSGYYRIAVFYSRVEGQLPFVSIPVPVFAPIMQYRDLSMRNRSVKSRHHTKKHINGDKAHNRSEFGSVDTLLRKIRTEKDYEKLLSALDELHCGYADLSREQLQVTSQVLLKLAYFASLRRNIALVGPAYIVLYCPILASVTFSFGWKSLITWCTIAICALSEILYYAFFHWNWDIGYDAYYGRYLPYHEMMTCTPAGMVVLRILNFVVMVAQSLVFLLQVVICICNTIRSGFLHVQIPDDFPYILCLPEELGDSPLRGTLRTIEKIDNILSMPDFFPALLAAYPMRCPFNSTQRLVKILMRTLSVHKTAIWLSDESCNQLNWYQGRIVHTVSVKNIRKLLADLRLLQLYSRPFNVASKKDQRYLIASTSNSSGLRTPLIGNSTVLHNQDECYVQSYSSDEELDKIFELMWDDSIRNFATDFPELEQKMLPVFTDVENQIMKL